MSVIYLDYNASTPIDRRVYDAMVPFLTREFGNPSSSHTIGKTSNDALEVARGQVARCIGATPDDIVFMSGGTETINYVFKGVFERLGCKPIHLIVSAVEHVAVQECCKYLEGKGASVNVLPVDGEGIVSLESLRSALRPETALVSVMAVNNEVGCIEPIAELVQIVRDYEQKHGTHIVFHTDASQAIGKVPFSVSTGVDFATIAGHKIYGPKGIGALFCRESLPSFIHGANHERGRRAGTENVPYIVGLGKAMEIISSELEADMNRLRALRTLLQKRLTSLCHIKCRINGPTDETLKVPHVLSISFEHVSGTQLVKNLSESLCMSTGAACHHGDGISEVLRAMKVPVAFARGTLRLSVGRPTTEAEIESAAVQIINEVKNLNDE